MAVQEGIIGPKCLLLVNEKSPLLKQRGLSISIFYRKEPFAEPFQYFSFYYPSKPGSNLPDKSLDSIFVYKHPKAG